MEKDQRINVYKEDFEKGREHAKKYDILPFKFDDVQSNIIDIVKLQVHITRVLYQMERAYFLGICDWVEERELRQVYQNYFIQYAGKYDDIDEGIAGAFWDGFKHQMTQRILEEEISSINLRLKFGKDVFDSL